MDCNADLKIIVGTLFKKFPGPLGRHILRCLEVNPEDFAELAELNEDRQMSLWTSAASAARNQE